MNPGKLNWQPFFHFSVNVSMAFLNPGYSSAEDLCQSIVLMDEFYLDSVEQYTNEDKSFFPIFFNVIPFAKECIATNVMGGQFNQRQGLIHRALIPDFAFETLTTLFRSDSHISQFSNFVIHEFKQITRTSAKVLGCSVSTQTAVPWFVYTRETVNQVLSKSVISEFDKSNRKAIVFAIGDADTEVWEQKLNTFAHSVTVEDPKVGFHDASFTGSQFASVIILVEDLLPVEEDPDNRRTFALLNLALTRAESEVFIFANERQASRVEVFMAAGGTAENLTDEDKLYKQLLLELNNQQPVNLKFLTADTVWNDKLKDFVAKVTRICVQQQNKGLLEKLITKVGVAKMPLRELIGALDNDKTDSFLKFLADNFGAKLRWAMKLAVEAEPSCALASRSRD